MATKDKFGVPIDSGANATGSGILMPKLKYRFRVTLLNFGTNESTRELTQNVQNVTRPVVTYDEIVVESYNSKVYMHGKHTWDPITLVIRDDIQNSVAKYVGSQVQAQVNHYQQTTPASGSDYKFDMEIDILDGNRGDATETWKLEGCFIQNVNYSDSDYSANEPITITLQIRFDNAIHEVGGNDLDGKNRAAELFPEITDFSGTSGTI
jgi:hypothetical protein